MFKNGPVFVIQMSGFIWFSAGVVAHPSEREFGGYAEMIAGTGSGFLIDYGVLTELFDDESTETLRKMCEEWVEQALTRGDLIRESKWTESVVVGSQDFVETVKEKLGSRAKRRKVSTGENEPTPCEPQELFGGPFVE